MDDREQLLRRDGLLIGVAGLSLLNGMHFSPLFDLGYLMIRPFAASFFIRSPILTFYFTSLLLSLMTLLLAGVPAALYERVKGLKESTPASLGIWLAGVLVLSVPTLLRLSGVWR